MAVVVGAATIGSLSLCVSNATGGIPCKTTLEVWMNESSMGLQPIPSPPRAVAISGILFSTLYIVSLVLVRVAAPADPRDPGVWLADPAFRYWIGIALNLIPFTGIAFLWFMAVFRSRIGLLEDRFFATVFLGSGFLFVAMLFASAAVTWSLLITFTDRLPGQSDAYQVNRSLAYALMQMFGIRMAAVFMFVTSTIRLRTGILTRWVSFVGFAFGLVLLLAINAFSWIALLFPFWAIIVSVDMLLHQGPANHNPKSADTPIAVT